MTVLWNAARFIGVEHAEALRETVRSKVAGVELELAAVADRCGDASSTATADRGSMEANGGSGT
jgi:hypothetical protein